MSKQDVYIGKDNKNPNKWIVTINGQRQGNYYSEKEAKDAYEKMKDKKVSQANVCPECDSAGSGHTATCSKYLKKESNISKVLSILESEYTPEVYKKHGKEYTIEYKIYSSTNKNNYPNDGSLLLKTESYKEAQAFLKKQKYIDKTHKEFLEDSSIKKITELAIGRYPGESYIKTKGYIK